MPWSVLWEQLVMVGLMKGSVGDLRGVVHCGYCPVFKAGYAAASVMRILLFGRDK
jgi:hypothetical protein